MSADIGNFRVVKVARCPEHGLHGERSECFICQGPVEQEELIPLSLLKYVAKGKCDTPRRVITDHDPAGNTYEYLPCLRCGRCMAKTVLHALNEVGAS